MRLPKCIARNFIADDNEGEMSLARTCIQNAQCRNNGQQDIEFCPTGKEAIYGKSSIFL